MVTWFCSIDPDVRVRDGLVHLAVRTHSFSGEVKELCDFVLPMSRALLLTQGLVAAIEEHEGRPVNVVAFGKISKRSANRFRKTREPDDDAPR